MRSENLFHSQNSDVDPKLVQELTRQVQIAAEFFFEEQAFAELDSIFQSNPIKNTLFLFRVVPNLLNHYSAELSRRKPHKDYELAILGSLCRFLSRAIVTYDKHPTQATDELTQAAITTSIELAQQLLENPEQAIESAELVTDLLDYTCFTANLHGQTVDQLSSLVKQNVEALFLAGTVDTSKPENIALVDALIVLGHHCCDEHIIDIAIKTANLSYEIWTDSESEWTAEQTVALQNLYDSSVSVVSSIGQSRKALEYCLSVLKNEEFNDDYYDRQDLSVMADSFSETINWRIQDYCDNQDSSRYQYNGGPGAAHALKGVARIQLSELPPFLEAFVVHALSLNTFDQSAPLDPDQGLILVELAEIRGVLDLLESTIEKLIPIHGVDVIYERLAELINSVAKYTHSYQHELKLRILEVAEKAFDSFQRDVYS